MRIEEKRRIKGYRDREIKKENEKIKMFGERVMEEEKERKNEKNSEEKEEKKRESGQERIEKKKREK